MMKKISYLAFALMFFLVACTSEEVSEIDSQEEAFNNSGRAKAIESETDMWMLYEDEVAGFSLQYPHDVVLNENNDLGILLSLETAPIESLEGTLGFDRETAESNKIALSLGDYGVDVDFPLESSKKVRSLESGINAQEFMVLGRFEVCDMTFERKLYFFNHDHQVVVSLEIPLELVREELNSYLKQDNENCGGELVWDFDKQSDFFDDLSAEDFKGELLSRWFKVFDQIVGTIKVLPASDEIALDASLLQGKWRSLDDEKSVIEFRDSYKIDYYNQEKLSEDYFNFDPYTNHLVVTGDDIEEALKYSVEELDQESLVLMYLWRGNFLKYKRLE